MFHDETDQAFTAPRDDQVDELVLLEHFRDTLAVGKRDDGKGSDRDPGFLHRFAQNTGDGHIGIDRLGPAAEDDGIAGLQAERRGIGGHIGPRLINDADDAERDPHFADHQAVGAFPHARHLAHRIRERRHFPQAVRHGPDAFPVQHQPVEHGRRNALFPGRIQVFGILGQKVPGTVLQRPGHCQEQSVFLG